MRFTSKILASAIAVIALGAGASSAIASDSGSATIDPVSDCRQVTVGSIIQKLCVEVGTRKSINTAGTVTVAPYFQVTCPTPSAVSCTPIGASVGTTGFALNPYGPRPQIFPDGSVYMAAGTLGTLYVGGFAEPVNTPEICVGSDAGCPGLT